MLQKGYYILFLLFYFLIFIAFLFFKKHRNAVYGLLEYCSYDFSGYLHRWWAYFIYNSAQFFLLFLLNNLLIIYHISVKGTWSLLLFKLEMSASINNYAPFQKGKQKSLQWLRHLSNSWDEWVGVDRLMKHNEENVLKQQALDKKQGVDKNVKSGRSAQTKPKSSTG